MQSGTQTDCVDTLWLRAAILVSNLPSLACGWVSNLLRGRGTARKNIFALYSPPTGYKPPTLVLSVHLKSRWPSVTQSASSRRPSGGIGNCEQSIGTKKKFCNLGNCELAIVWKRRCSTACKEGERELIRRLIFIISSPNHLTGWRYIYIFSGGRDLVFVASTRQFSVRFNFKVVKGWGLCPFRFHVLLSHGEVTRTCFFLCTGHWRIHAGCLTTARNTGKEH